MKSKTRFIIFLCSYFSTTAVAQGKAKSLGTFEREQTLKQNVELLQLDEDKPSTENSNKTVPRSNPEVEKTKREIERLKGHIETGQQMLTENEKNQSAQVKILSTLMVLKTELRKLERKLRMLQAEEKSDTPINMNSDPNLNSSYPPKTETPE